MELLLEVLDEIALGAEPAKQFMFNPIESVFSQVKRVFCRERLNKLVNNEKFDANKAIRAAFNKVSRETVAACVKKSMCSLRDLKA